MNGKHCEIVTVLSLADSKKNGEYIAVLSDGAEIAVSAVHIADFGLYVGRELSDSELSEMIGSLKLRKAKSRAINILGNRSLSAAEIKKRLVNKGEDDEVAQSVADWLLELGLIDDEQYARAIVTHYTSKGYGPLRIKDEMYRRGIPRDMFSEVLAELDDSDIASAAETYLMKKLKGEIEADDLKRAANALIRRGFSYEQVDVALRNYKEQHMENA